jgi:hypothetical protein
MACCAGCSHNTKRHPFPFLLFGYVDIVGFLLISKDSSKNGVFVQKFFKPKLEPNKEGRYFHVII